MARFIRDEKRNYPFVWLAIGGIFAGSAAWAVYAELVTRVPWQKHQQAFFEFVERELAYLRDLDQAALVRLRLKEGDVRQWLAQDTEAQMAPVRERQVA